MSMKKNLLAMLAVYIFTFCPLTALDRPAPALDVEDEEVPILAPKKQLEKQMKDFKRYLNRVKRCLFTGPCTKEEKAQVWRHGMRLMKLVALAAGVGLLYKYRRPIGAIPEKVRGKVQEEVAGVSEAVAAGAMRGAGLQAGPGAPPLKVQLSQIAQNAVEGALRGGLLQTGPGALDLKTQLNQIVQSAVAGALAGAQLQTGPEAPLLQEQVSEIVKNAVDQVVGVGVEPVRGWVGLPTGGFQITKQPPAGRGSSSSSASEAATAAEEELRASEFVELDPAASTIQAIKAKENETGRSQDKAKAISTIAKKGVEEINRKQIGQEEKDDAIGRINQEKDYAIGRIQDAESRASAGAQ